MKLDIKIEKRDIVRTAVTIAYVLIAAVVSIFVSQGVDFRFDKIFCAEFVGPLLVNLIILIVVYNTCSTMLLENIKYNKDGKYFYAYSRFAKCVLYIKRNKLHKELEEKVAEYNEELKKQAYEIELFKITDRINYEEIGDYDVKANPFRLREKELQKFIQLQAKYNSGALKYAKMRPEYITRDKVLFPGTYQKGDLGYDIKKHKAVRNAVVMISFFVTQVILNSIIFNPQGLDFLTVLITQGTLFCSAIFSSFTNANIINNATISSLTEKADWCQRFGFEEHEHSAEAKNEEIAK